MNIRKFKNKDAARMISWMKDDNITKYLDKSFKNYSLDDCKKFIEHSKTDKKNAHFAIVSDQDDYMGTVSLKHIDKVRKCAEFAIVVNSEAISKGYSWFGMGKILDIAFEKMRLNYIYWCVSKANKRAIKFYKKHGFHIIKDIPKELMDLYSNKNMLWYLVQKGDNYRISSEVCGCKIINIETIPTIGSGELSFFETNRNIPFNIKRIYYISKVPKNKKRGYHAHKNLKQLIFCPYGSIQLLLDDGYKREKIILSDPSIGILIDKPIWREMLWLKKDSVLCVGASQYYNKKDYIRNYSDYINYIKTKH